MPQQVSNPTLTKFVTLQATACWCGVAFAVESHFLRRTRDEKGRIFCPLGHEGVYGSVHENERLRRQLATAEAEKVQLLERILAEEQQRKRSERSARALRGQVTKAKKRAVAGVCPVADCHRHFTDLERHIGTKHPGYSGQDIG